MLSLRRQGSTIYTIALAHQSTMGTRLRGYDKIDKINKTLITIIPKKEKSDLSDYDWYFRYTSFLTLSDEIKQYIVIQVIKETILKVYKINNDK